MSNYEEFLLLKGLGPSTLRALSLVLELVYDVHPSWKDPVTHPPLTRSSSPTRSAERIGFPSL